MNAKHAMTTEQINERVDNLSRQRAAVASERDKARAVLDAAILAGAGPDMIAASHVASLEAELGSFDRAIQHLKLEREAAENRELAAQYTADVVKLSQQIDAAAAERAVFEQESRAFREREAAYAASTFTVRQELRRLLSVHQDIYGRSDWPLTRKNEVAALLAHDRREVQHLAEQLGYDN